MRCWQVCGIISKISWNRFTTSRNDCRGRKTTWSRFRSWCRAGQRRRCSSEWKASTPLCWIFLIARIVFVNATMTSVRQELKSTDWCRLVQKFGTTFNRFQCSGNYIIRPPDNSRKVFCFAPVLSCLRPSEGAGQVVPMPTPTLQTRTQVIPVLYIPPYNSRKVCFASVLSLLFWHPHSYLPDGRETSRQKYTRVLIVGQNRKKSLRHCDHVSPKFYTFTGGRKVRNLASNFDASYRRRIVVLKSSNISQI